MTKKFLNAKFDCTVKLEFKERLNNEQLGNGEAFPVTNMPG